MTSSSAIPFWILPLVALACSNGGGKADAGTDADADADADTDADSDTDTDTGTDECASVACDQECVRFADVEASEGGNGLSWETAFRTVQPAIDAAAVWAACCGTPCQVWIARGTYYVYENSVHDTIDLADRVQVYGSFSKEEGSPEEREIETNPTILDGRAGPDSDERVYHVVTAEKTHEDDVFDDVILDGLTITRGAAMGEISSKDAVCAGLSWGARGNPIVRKCSFVENESVQGASGACFGAELLTIEDCQFIGNTAQMTGSLSYGGALTITGEIEAKISRCLFDGNAADVGAAISAVAYYNDTSVHLVVENSIFKSNVWSHEGTLLEFHTWPSSPDSSADIRNSTFMDNVALGPEEQVEEFRGTFNVTFRNSIDNNGSVIYPSPGDYNLVGVDPLFVDPENGDFRLQPGSPCIDAADGTVAPEFDFLGNPRVDDPDSLNTGLGPPWADIGAFEFQPE